MHTIFFMHPPVIKSLSYQFYNWKHTQNYHFPVFHIFSLCLLVCAFSSLHCINFVSHDLHVYRLFNLCLFLSFRYLLSYRSMFVLSGFRKNSSTRFGYLIHPCKLFSTIIAAFTNFMVPQFVFLSISFPSYLHYSYCHISQLHTTKSLLHLWAFLHSHTLPNPYRSSPSTTFCYLKTAKTDQIIAPISLHTNY